MVVIIVVVKVPIIIIKATNEIAPTNFTAEECVFFSFFSIFSGELVIPITYFSPRDKESG
jgi:hypothetical protein